MSPRLRTPPTAADAVVSGSRCGCLLAYFAWPVAWGAWYAQQADAVVALLREGRPINLPDTLAALDAFNRAVDANPSAPIRLERSELLAGAARELNWAAPDSQRA